MTPTGCCAGLHGAASSFGATGSCSRVSRAATTSTRIDSERRALTLHLDSDRLLRTVDNSRQGRTMDRIRVELRKQIRAQMIGRRAFREPSASR